MQMCEATDRNRIVKAEGVEASWHMTAKPTGWTPTVNAPLVHRKFAFLHGKEEKRKSFVERANLLNRPLRTRTVGGVGGDG